MNLLMLSGDASVAQGRQGAFYQMLGRFCAYWDRVDVLCPRAAGAQPRVVHGNVYVHPSPRHRAFQPGFIVRRGRALLAERPYALITSHDFGLFYNGAGARRLSRLSGVPYVSELHHVEGYPRAVTLRERLYRALAFGYIRRARRTAAAFRVVNSVEMPELLRRLGVPPHQILVLPSLYVDFDVFRPLPEEPRRYDVAFVGRLVANKGLFTIVEALAQVRQTHPGVRLVMLGQGPLRDRLVRRIEALRLSDQVTLLDRVETPQDMARFYNRAAMLVCASTAEGGPRVTVEAMACGVPVITTPVGIMRELVQDGVNGLVFHWQAGELAAHIRRLLDDPALRARLAAAGQAAVQPYRAEQVIARLAQGYHALIARLREQG